jgi:hypothetical protein
LSEVLRLLKDRRALLTAAWELSLVKHTSEFFRSAQGGADGFVFQAALDVPTRDAEETSESRRVGFQRSGVSPSRVVFNEGRGLQPLQLLRERLRERLLLGELNQLLVGKKLGRARVLRPRARGRGQHHQKERRACDAAHPYLFY